MQNPFRSIHFIGICGTAMGAVAAALKDAGYEVTGSDENVYPPMSTFLESKGIRIMQGFKPENLAHKPDLIVVGNAIKRGTEELEAVLEQKLYYLSLPEVLKQFFLRGRHNLVVTGTHGKTTTTSILAWIFEYAGKAPSYMIGGIPKNLSQGCVIRDSKHFILEGDEYDTAFFDKRSKFLHYLPELVIMNNVEFDHADIFASLDDVKTTFKRLVNIVPRNGMIIYNEDDANIREIIGGALSHLVSVGTSDNSALQIQNTKYFNDRSEWTLKGLGDFKFHMIGEINVRNASMAIAAAHFYQIPLETIREAVAQFAGIKRRQEVRGEVNGITVIDDFGHHPTAMKQTFFALHHRYPGRKVWAIFEPRSNTTRRNIFQKELPEALGMADGVFVAQVHLLEKIPPAERLNPEKVMADIRAMGKPAFYEPDADTIVAKAKDHVKPGDVVVVFSNGGFGGIHQKLLDALK
ncbi:UDP-N-acetylmuramate:L-alanyl-gamma-D-glutamyl-meso-diaminopimelate ligase [Kamptonema cortianum]|uniref:UDP-N-acetylmuramate:L-alanyl-gamma-D-glutamyl-meso-diaminopimelate ligase n=1 Tax=Geitlerinema calcuttense NRMC-F 0142 TaxID=2922238 RepID=A0ABT7LX89_9CYAN|nr:MULTISPECIES: UDP-N-acetylmuramate:L-alanyl-gamma-D-glutamyl-meso-diaminopimelate ligase [Cyanophyceae]MDK3156667.1 UDP-N-acetylmuramate:L-alanyl-gamma-D-glutamyl-meso-diaminopimelate ligase [Kamptonema cortianum]MDL5050325.1 UDP-N-acetylmuramate:L-alanyl-gamma-D-glutamyl-meso-diaminopimelate ligase [Oscillatoria amoena NRMC-F 0135]MDL5053404.1 UDP-N-acetylmuramate:L-alanyl-gamma-D-glutamyl-meso-diaminopimelate ligase [Oscillatoria laete-virens NRMC-F 0139]MDL5056622.1 UDP-N-acetylmuramate:L